MLQFAEPLFRFLGSETNLILTCGSTGECSGCQRFGVFHDPEGLNGSLGWGRTQRRRSVWYFLEKLNDRVKLTTSEEVEDGLCSWD